MQRGPAILPAKSLALFYTISPCSLKYFLTAVPTGGHLVVYLLLLRVLLSFARTTLSLSTSVVDPFDTRRRLTKRHSLFWLILQEPFDRRQQAFQCFEVAFRMLVPVVVPVVSQIRYDGLAT